MESRTDRQVVLVKGHRPNHLLHFFIGLFTLGLWWLLVWLPLTIFGGEKRKVLNVETAPNAEASGAVTAIGS